jgi:hypothetical protein
MNATTQIRANPDPSSTPAPSGLLRRKCACGGTPGPSGECAECRKRRLQRRFKDRAEPSAVPPIVHEVLRSPGRPLDPATRSFMEPRFGHDFGRVRVHTDAKAAESARKVGALAYTVGQDIVFAAHQYGPNDPRNLHLLVHELTHTVQQGVPRGEVGAKGLEIEAADTPSERQAETSATSILSERRPRLARGTNDLRLARRGPMPAPAPVRPPPVRAPASRAPGGTLAPGSPAPSGGTYQAPIWVPDQADNSLEAMLQRGAIRDYAERERLRQERPVATLERGGQPPRFITEQGTRTHSWLGGPSGGGSVTVRVRKFHVLDAIEYEVGRANTEADLQAILQRYVPMVALLNEAIEMSRGGSRLFAPMGGVPLLAPIWDEPVYPVGFDPRGEARLQVFEGALRRRADQVPSLAQSRLKPQSRRRGGCRIEPISPLGDDPMSVLYCHLATGSPYSYKITIESATGAATQRWAEIDSLRGNTWYECKCGYEALLSGEARGEGVARAVLDKLDKQVLNHVDIARTCGLEYRYIVSSERVAETLRQRWFGNVVINVVPFEGCE